MQNHLTWGCCMLLVELTYSWQCWVGFQSPVSHHLALSTVLPGVYGKWSLRKASKECPSGNSVSPRTALWVWSPCSQEEGGLRWLQGQRNQIPCNVTQRIEYLTTLNTAALDTQWAHSFLFPSSKASEIPLKRRATYSSIWIWQVGG